MFFFLFSWSLTPDVCALDAAVFVVVLLRVGPFKPIFNPCRIRICADQFQWWWVCHQCKYDAQGNDLHCTNCAARRGARSLWVSCSASHLVSGSFKWPSWEKLTIMGGRHVWFARVHFCASKDWPAFGKVFSEAPLSCFLLYGEIRTKKYLSSLVNSGHRSVQSLKWGLYSVMLICGCAGMKSYACLHWRRHKSISQWNMHWKALHSQPAFNIVSVSLSSFRSNTGLRSPEAKWPYGFMSGHPCHCATDPPRPTCPALTALFWLLTTGGGRGATDSAHLCFNFCLKRTSFLKFGSSTLQNSMVPFPVCCCVLWPHCVIARAIQMKRCEILFAVCVSMESGGTLLANALCDMQGQRAWCDFTCSPCEMSFRSLLLQLEGREKNFVRVESGESNGVKGWPLSQAKCQCSELDQSASAISKLLMFCHVSNCFASHETKPSATVTFRLSRMDWKSRNTTNIDI